ncbi:MAG: hypothetical protein ACYS1C_09120 [Planctomycetota bacterium]|jgi:prepilin-type processing-associated H-X9-DG protein
MRRAFTAVELVVVLVIVLILGIMILPALEEGQRGARKAKCVGRVRQVGMACQMYQSHFDNRWPAGRRSVSPESRDGPDPTASLGALYPGFASKPYLFQCPGTSDVVVLPPEGGDFLNCLNFFVSPEGKATRPESEGQRPPRPPSYFYDAPSPRRRGIPLNSRSSRVVYGDECVHGYWEGDRGKGRWIGENNHRGGGNFLFADKHVEWLEQQWKGLPWRKGSWPYVPNPHLREYMATAKGHGFNVMLDTYVFWDNWEGRRLEADADLAGMVWIGDSWKEF